MKLGTARQRKTKHQNKRSGRLRLAGSPYHPSTAIPRAQTTQSITALARRTVDEHARSRDLETRCTDLILYTVTALVNSISLAILDRLFLIEWIPSNRYTRFSPRKNGTFLFPVMKPRFTHNCLLIFLQLMNTPTPSLLRLATVTILSFSRGMHQPQVHSQLPTYFLPVDACTILRFTDNCHCSFFFFS